MSFWELHKESKINQLPGDIAPVLRFSQLLLQVLLYFRHFVLEFGGFGFDQLDAVFVTLANGLQFALHFLEPLLQQ